MLEKLRLAMIEQGLDLLIVVSTDEHLNEYSPKQNRRLEAVTGFSGSAGTAIICVAGRSQLFVDSRYHLQAEQSCAEEFEIQKLGNEGILKPQKWPAQSALNVPENQSEPDKKLRIGADPFVMSPKVWRDYEKALENSGHTLVPTKPNLVDSVWSERPSPPKKEIYPLPLEYSGKDSATKLREVRKAVSDSGADVLLLTMLDEIAWLTNLRGSDIEYNPVFEAYAAVFSERAICFCHHPQTDFSELCPEWEFRPYAQYPEFLRKLAKQKSIKVWLDSSAITMGTRLVFSEEQIYEKESPLVLAKALKNPAELKAIKKAHRQAGGAVVRSFWRLQKAFEAGQAVSEKEYSDWLYEEYAKAEGFAELSFGTIAASGAHGAIVHYGNPDSEQAMCSGELLLVDSGIQCAGGTTDATRTVILGEANNKQKRIYTLVLQAHIRLARQIFPEGTKGAALDAIARSGLWDAGLDYGHGTGHGVGAFLNVHEGPQRISPVSHDVALQAGMVLSNEPGYYEKGWGGIRLENLYVVEKAEGLPEHPGGKGWLRFEALTLIPWERHLIDRSLLSPQELQWLDKYQARVLREIGPLTESVEEQQWPTRVCGAAGKPVLIK